MPIATGDYSEKQAASYAQIAQGGQATVRNYLDAPPTTQPVSAITDVHLTFEEARILSHRVKEIVGRLIGYAQEDPNKCGIASDAIFDGLKCNSVDTRHAINEAMDALRRLESQLP